MPARLKAQLFTDGESQAVRLPADFRFECDEKTQNMILSPQPDGVAWDEFLALRQPIEVPDDWMVDRPLNSIPSDREPLFREED